MLPSKVVFTSDGASLSFHWTCLEDHESFLPSTKMTFYRSLGSNRLSHTCCADTRRNFLVKTPVSGFVSIASVFFGFRVFVARDRIVERLQLAANVDQEVVACIIEALLPLIKMVNVELRSDRLFCSGVVDWKALMVRSSYPINHTWILINQQCEKTDIEKCTEVDAFNTFLESNADNLDFVSTRISGENDSKHNKTRNDCYYIFVKALRWSR